MSKADKPPVTADEIRDLIHTLTETNYDNEGAHAQYDDILERYCLHPDPALSFLMGTLILDVRNDVEFWYA